MRLDCSARDAGEGYEEDERERVVDASLVLRSVRVLNQVSPYLTKVGYEQPATMQATAPPLVQQQLTRFGQNFREQVSNGSPPPSLTCSHCDSGDGMWRPRGNGLVARASGTALLVSGNSQTTIK